MSARTHAEVIGSHAYLLVEDLMAGRKNVYTVYKIQISGSKRAKIIGRELPLDDAHTLIQQHSGDLVGYEGCVK